MRHLLTESYMIYGAIVLPLSANGNRLRLLKKVADQIRKTTVACLDHHFIIKHPDSHNFHFR